MTATEDLAAAASMSAAGAAGTADQSWAQVQDWEPHRELLTRLWYVDDKPLREVMEIMRRDHGFRATAKMYKSRFENWGLHKNLSARRRERIRVDIMDGKVTQLPVLRRRQLKPTKSRLSSRCPEVTYDVGVATPSENTYRTVSHPPILARKPRDPDQFRFLEKSFFALHNYSSSRLRDHLWDLENHDFNSDLTRSWGSEINWAAKKIQGGGDIAAGFKLLDRCCALYRTTLLREDALLIWVTLYGIIKLSQVDEQLALSFAKFVAGISNIELGRQHPITILWANVLSMGIAQTRATALQLMVAQMDIFHAHTSPGNAFWVVSYVNAMDFLFGAGLCSLGQVLEICETLYRELIEHPGQDIIGSEMWASFVRATAVNVWLHSSEPDRFESADSLLSEIEEWKRTRGKNRYDEHLINDLHIRADVEEGLGRYDRAEMFQHRVVQVSLERKPRGHRRILKSYSNLEAFYRRRGNIEAANEAQKKGLAEAEWLVTVVGDQPQA